MKLDLDKYLTPEDKEIIVLISGWPEGERRADLIAALIREKWENHVRCRELETALGDALDGWQKAQLNGWPPGAAEEMAEFRRLRMVQKREDSWRKEL